MTPAEDRRRRYFILAAMSGVLGLVVFDETVVGVALPTIRRDLAMTEIASHWVVNAYLLTFTCFVALAGRLGDTLGRNRVFLFGIVVFGSASLAAGLAPNGALLIAARAFQGIGAAILFPSAFAIVTGLFPAEQRGIVFGVQTTVGGLFMAAGPLAGGVLTQTLSWRWIFLINLPVVLAIGLVVLTAWIAPIAAKDTKRKEAFDLFGLVFLLLGLTGLTIGLMQGTEWGWRNLATLLLLLGGTIAIGVFLVIEHLRSQALIELGLFRLPPFTGGVLIFFTFQFDKVVVFVFMPLYLQQVLQLSPIAAGLPLVVATLPTVITSIVAGRSADRFGSRMPTIVGLLFNGSALLFMGIAAAAKSYEAIFSALILWGIVLPFASVVPRRALMSAVPETHQGQASGVNLTVQMMGGTIGMAVATVVLTATRRFELVFLVTGLLVLASIMVAWFTFDRRPASHN